MKEFIEKLIGKLEEYKYSHLVERDSEMLEHCKEKEDDDCYLDDCFACVWDKAIEIVNQIAEEYNNGWIACSERLPEEDVLEDGYVEPSEAVLVLTKYNSYKVSRYWGNRRNKRDYHDWVDIEYRKNEVIAWKPIAPYQPKGE